MFIIPPNDEPSLKYVVKHIISFDIRIYISTDANKLNSFGAVHSLAEPYAAINLLNKCKS